MRSAFNLITRAFRALTAFDPFGPYNNPGYDMHGWHMRSPQGRSVTIR